MAMMMRRTKNFKKFTLVYARSICYLFHASMLAQNGNGVIVLKNSGNNSLGGHKT